MENLTDIKSNRNKENLQRFVRLTFLMDTYKTLPNLKNEAIEIHIQSMYQTNDKE